MTSHRTADERKAPPRSTDLSLPSPSPSLSPPPTRSTLTVAPHTYRLLLSLVHPLCTP